VTSPAVPSLASGLRVIEIGESISAALAGMVLADYGADVVVVEPPGGSRLRALPAWAMWARGKRCAALDLAAAEGRGALRELVRAADVALVALEPSTADRLGVDGPSLTAINPLLVHAEITGFGRGHPMSGIPGHEATVVCKGGRAHEFAVLFGGDRPAYPAVPVATYGAAMLAVQAVCAALVERERTGRGQHLSTSLMDAVSVFDMVTWAPGGDLSLRVADNPLLFYTVGRTRDGVWLQFSQNSPRLFRAFLQAIDLEQLLDEPRYKGAPSFVSPVDGREMRAVLMARIGERTWAEWQEVFAADSNVSAEEFARPGDALAHPQLLHTGDSRTVEDPARGPVTWLGPLIDAPVAPAIVHAPAPPDPASTAPPAWRAASVAPAAPSAPAAAVASGASSGRADGHLLQGITVLELSTWIATPTSSSLLGDMGARVIKIEPLEGDPVRQHGLAAMRTVQGKECILIDLKAPAARDVMHRLAAHADVLLHNYRPGVPERLGIDYETLRGVNPRLVYLYAASYGSTGPMAARPAFHVTCGAVCGGALAQAGAGNPPLPGVELSPEELAHWSYYLSKSNEANPDYNAGLAAAAAITMALYHRSRTGVGQALETRMMLSNSYTLSEHFIDFPGRPPRVLPDQQVFGLHALMRLYPAASGWVCVAAPSAAEFARLCDGLGRPDVAADARFASEKARRVHDADLASVLGAVLATRTAGEWEAALAPKGIACVEVHPAQHASYVFDAPWGEELGFVETTLPTGAGPYRRYGRGVRTAYDLGRSTGADVAGADTRSVLESVGYSPSDVDALLAAGVVAGPAAD